jgi:hypothetical protein
MNPEYLDCELCLTDYDQASLTVADIEHSGRPALDDALLAKLLASLDPQEYGRALFEALLPADSDLLSGYREALAVARHKEKLLRFRLHLAATAPPSLHILRWELLHDPKKGITFGCSREVVFSRYSAVSEPVRPEVRETPRLLVALADPSDLADYGLPAMNPIAARSAIEEALAPLAGLMHWEILAPPVTAARLSDRLLNGDFHALHLQAHGLLRPEQATASLVLEREDGRADFVNEASLSQIFEGTRALRLVTLIACHGGSPSGEEPLSGLGPGLVRRGVPAVVAMRQAVSFSTAADFCRHFYRNLARGGSVDRAVNESRHQLRLTLHDRSDEWGTPILFMRLHDGLLWKPRALFPGPNPRPSTSDINWTALIERIQSDNLVPIFGPGLCHGFLPSPSEIAEIWAAKYDGFPLDRRTDLPAVAQFVEIKEEEPGYPRDRLLPLLAAELVDRERGQERSRFQRLRPSEIIKQIAESHFAADPDEPHLILSSFPLSLYITTNCDNLMSSALRWTGKQPHVEHCRWREDLMPEGYGGLRGTSEKPLVFHMYGNDADPNSIVLTEDDHLDFLRAIIDQPDRIQPLKERLTEDMLLFLGYDVRRLDCRVLLRGIIAHLKPPRRSRIAVLQIDPEEDDAPRAEELRTYMEGCCNDLKIKVYWGSARDFLCELRRQMKGNGRVAA